MSFSLIDEIVKSWTRPVQESYGYKFIRSKDGYILIANTLGIDEKDLQLDLDRKVFSLKGETKNEDIDFINKVNYRFDVSRLKEKIEKIEYEVKNGLTIVHFFVENSDEKKIEISRK